MMQSFTDFKRMGLAVFAIVMSGAAARAQSQAPTFTQDKLTLTINEYESSVSHDFTKRPIKSDFNIKMEGTITLPKDMDVICVGERLEPKVAIDAKKNGLIKPPTRPVAPNPTRDNFNAFIGGVAPVELEKAEYKANPHEIAKMTVETWMLVAKERKEAIVPARVLEEAKDIGYGMRVRVSSMKIDSRRGLELMMEFTRPQGTGGAILESVVALDEKGKELGGGRWGRGLRIFEGSGKFQTEFPVPANSSVHSFKCVIVTKHELKAVRFDIDGVFQQ